MISADLITNIRQVYRLNWHGIHGVEHWARVRHIGLKLAQQTGPTPTSSRFLPLSTILNDIMMVLILSMANVRHIWSENYWVNRCI
jgi:hypothetical protein